ncbi:MAG: hypothetical protein NTV05_05775 [Acidobacteria bacterium]|nr:hypothetical protein [Acidobacteriota bacterium]
MLHRIPLALALVLGILASGRLTADSRPFVPAARIDILVDGAPRPQYTARGTSYIEALKGRPYAIRVTNPYPVRVAVALSVDGLNTIDARHTTAAAARKWVIEPYGTVVISGWQTSLSDARRFEFTTEARSYGASLGRIEDLGVISAVYFRERLPKPMPVTAWDSRSREGAAPSGASRNAEGAGAAGSADAAAARRGSEAAKAAPGAAPSVAAQSAEYAATGMGRSIDHAVTAISLDLEDTPAASLTLRYEYRTVLVRLGVLPAVQPGDEVLDRRERARGFAPGFCPEPKR